MESPDNADTINLENAKCSLEEGLMNNLRGPILIILLYAILTFKYSAFERIPLLYLVVNRGFPRTWLVKELIKICDMPAVVRPLETMQSVAEKYREHKTLILKNTERIDDALRNCLCDEPIEVGIAKTTGKTTCDLFRPRIIISAYHPDMYVRQNSIVLQITSPRDVYFSSNNNTKLQIPAIGDTKLSKIIEEISVNKSPLLPGFPIRVVADCLVKLGKLSLGDREIIESVLNDCEEIAKRDCLLNEDRELLNAVLNLFDSSGKLAVMVKTNNSSRRSESIPLKILCEEIMKSQREIGLLLPTQLSLILNKYAVVKESRRRRYKEEGGDGGEPLFVEGNTTKDDGKSKLPILTHVVIDLSRLEDILGRE
jgi:hypothetical protein